MRYDFRRIYEWPLLPKLVLVGIVCLLVFYLGYLFDISDLNVKLKASIQQESDLKDQIRSLANNQAQLDKQLTKFPVLESTIAKQQKQLTRPADLPELLNEIIALGKQNSVDILSFSPGPVDEKGTYPKVEIKMTVAGSYDQLAKFISQVVNMQRVVEVNNMTIAKIVEEKKLTTGTVSDNVLTADLNLIVYEAKKL
ncbi:MAG: type 4a pilus biogenesis protein PilO [Gammaproteobacteria bacterium]|nr:type 4a pilus biogenesis protein PilO [Gammaproteobacteria bacterium]